MDTSDPSSLQNRKKQHSDPTSGSASQPHAQVSECMLSRLKDSILIVMATLDW